MKVSLHCIWVIHRAANYKFDKDDTERASHRFNVMSSKEITTCQRRINLDLDFVFANLCHISCGKASHAEWKLFGVNNTLLNF